MPTCFNCGVNYLCQTHRFNLCYSCKLEEHKKTCKECVNIYIYRFLPKQCKTQVKEACKYCVRREIKYGCRYCGTYECFKKKREKLNSIKSICNDVCIQCKNRKDKLLCPKHHYIRNAKLFYCLNLSEKEVLTQNTTFYTLKLINKVRQENYNWLRSDLILNDQPYLFRSN